MADVLTKLLQAVKKMLTPGRSRPIGSEEIDNGADAKDGAATGNGGGRAETCRMEGTYENDRRAKEFLSTGRTGRRNALTEFLGNHDEPAMLDLPDRFEELSMETGESNNGGQDPNSPAGTSKQQG